eukprot:1186490-Prorocentrum_minimum.AAC.1
MMRCTLRRSERMDSPPTRASPVVGARSPVSMLSVVVLPAPLWPNSPNRSRVPKPMLRPRTASFVIPPPPHAPPSSAATEMYSFLSPTTTTASAS